MPIETKEELLKVRDRNCNKQSDLYFDKTTPEQQRRFEKRRQLEDLLELKRLEKEWELDL